MANHSEFDNLVDKSKSNSPPETIDIINSALNAPLMLMSIIGNTLVLAAILRTPSLRSPSTVFLRSLAVSDLLVGLVIQPVYVANQLTNDSLHQVMYTMAFCVCGVSVCTMTAISVDRFMALQYHMRYPNLMTTHRALFTSATLWIIVFLSSLLSLWSMNANYFAAAISTAMCLLCSTVCYIQIYRVVRHHQLQIHVQQQAVDSLNIQRSKRSAINTFIYYIVMILCYTPLIISMLMRGIPHIFVTKVWNLAHTVTFMNSAINPVLYCWRLRELRTAVLKVAREMLWKQTDGS